tara:strand:- start:184 stop:1107 length:924 start_codon:yes stop_codon:yes gene_type:complete
MQKYIHYEKWTGEITGHTLKKSDSCIKVNVPKDNIDNYIVFDSKLYKKDNIVRTPLEKDISNINYGKTATVKLNIFSNEKIVKVIIDKYFIQTFIDAYQFENIQFFHPTLKIYVHSKQNLNLLGIFEVDLDDYFKTGKYERDISSILKKAKVTDLLFKTQRCFELYAYEIIQNTTSIDENLTNEDCHIIIYRKDSQIMIQNNIKYWGELEDIKNHKFIISFFNKNRNYLEYYIPLILDEFDGRNHILIDMPLTVNLTSTKIHINSSRLKIKFIDDKHRVIWDEQKSIEKFKYNLIQQNKKIYENTSN